MKFIAKIYRVVLFALAIGSPSVSSACKAEVPFDVKFRWMDSTIADSELTNLATAIQAATGQAILYVQIDVRTDPTEGSDSERMMLAENRANNVRMQIQKLTNLPISHFDIVTRWALSFGSEKSPQDNRIAMVVLGFPVTSGCGLPAR